MKLRNLILAALVVAIIMFPVIVGKDLSDPSEQGFFLFSLLSVIFLLMIAYWIWKHGLLRWAGMGWWYPYGS